MEYIFDVMSWRKYDNAYFHDYYLSLLNHSSIKIGSLLIWIFRKCLKLERGTLQTNAINTIFCLLWLFYWINRILMHLYQTFCCPYHMIYFYIKMNQKRDTCLRMKKKSKFIHIYEHKYIASRIYVMFL